MKILVNNGCFMNCRLGYSSINLTLINVKIITVRFFSKVIEKERVKTTAGYQMLNIIQCWRLSV